MVSNQDKFHGIYERPYEPLFVPKKNGKLFYDLPEKFLKKRYRPIGQNIQNRFGMDARVRIPIKDIPTPDIEFAKKIPRRGDFSHFNRAHSEIAGKLVQMFMDAKEPDTLLALAAYCRPRLHPGLLQYALTVALQHREDTKNVQPPTALQTFPKKFMDPVVIPEVQEEGLVVSEGNRIPSVESSIIQRRESLPLYNNLKDYRSQVSIDIAMNFTASDKEPEQRLAYFREDIGLNLHHWHWHLVYPGFGPQDVVNKDRRGELFYYMHTQMLARYQAERFCNGLGRLVPLSNLRVPVTEAYYPKILKSSTNRTLPSRYKSMMLTDVNRPDDGLAVLIADVERSISRITTAIDNDVIMGQNGQRIPLNNAAGIDVLGNIVESSSLSANPGYYGDVHNSGHILLASIHDPDGTYLEGFGVMGDTTTAIRDPIFFRWHGFVDQLLKRHKNRLTPYTSADLAYSPITLVKLETALERQGSPANMWMTFWQRSQIDLGTGLDFGPEGSVFATFTHLQNAPFVYKLQVMNSDTKQRAGTVRIYLAPKYDDKGVLLTFDEQRSFAMEMDTFKVLLNPGTNNITRKSDQSSVAIPYERTFRNVAQSNLSGADVDQFRFCNCGWPSHLLIPKGTAAGVNYDLFAMISDYSKDTVNVDYDETNNCDDSHSFCGLRDRLYPDARSMGYPFDRKVSATIKTFPDFIAPYKNMTATTVTVKFTNSIVSRT